MTGLRLLGLLLASAACLLTACGGATTAPAAYVALGDSYSSGVGAGATGVCQRSRGAWVHRLGRDVTSLRACAGATTATVLAGQLAPLPPRTTLVTITIGGNDAGFVDVVASCLLGTTARCERRVARAERFVRRELRGRLRRVYRAIRRRAPQATVIVAGYPRLFAVRPWCAGFGRIDEREQRRLNAGSDLLARTIAAEVRRHRGFRFVDVRRAFASHGVCSQAPYVQGVANPLSASFHPNPAGQAAYARAVVASS